MKTIGIDLSLTGTGIVVLDDGKLVSKETISSKPTKEKTPTAEVERIIDIVDRVMKIVDIHHPDMVAIEGIAFMSRNSTALSQLSGLSYLLRKELHSRGIGFVVIAPTSLKKFATGSGNVGKDVIMLEVYKRFGVSILDNNQADAYILAQVALAVKDRERKTTKFQQEVINLIMKQVCLKT